MEPSLWPTEDDARQVLYCAELDCDDFPREEDTLQCRKQPKEKRKVYFWPKQYKDPSGFRWSRPIKGELLLPEILYSTGFRRNRWHGVSAEQWGRPYKHQIVIDGEQPDHKELMLKVMAKKTFYKAVDMTKPRDPKTREWQGAQHLGTEHGQRKSSRESWQNFQKFLLELFPELKIQNESKKMQISRLRGYPVHFVTQSTQSGGVWK